MDFSQGRAVVFGVASRPHAMDILAAAIDAEHRIRPHLPPSPLVRSEGRSRETGGEVYLKLESLQPTGSFKVRGALNTVLSLDNAARRRGVITASSGNHGAAVAFALSLAGAVGTVYVPEHASAGKVAAMRRLGATVVASGDDSLLYCPGISSNYFDTGIPRFEVFDDNYD